MKKLLYILMLYCSVVQSQNLLTSFDRLRQQQINTVSSKNYSLLSNFRVKDSHKDRIYFDSKIPLKSGSTSAGFFVDGKSITGLVVNPNSKKDHYLIVSTNLSYWDNLLISYSGGSNALDYFDKIMHTFKQKYIRNDIQEPATTRNLYVSDNASGSGDGLSESSPYTMSQAISNCQSGDHIWIKKGNYTGNYTIQTSGTSSSPIIFEGYNNSIGDLNYSVFHDTYPNLLSGNNMPLFTGSSRSSSDAFIINAKSNLIFKNIGVKNYRRGFYSSYTTPCNNIVFDNVSGEDFGTTTGSSNGDGMFINFTMNANQNKPNNIRVINSYARNASLSNFVLGGDNHLIVNSKSYNDAEVYTGTQNLNLSTDYHYRIGDGDYSAVISCYAENIGDQMHGSHGVALRGLYLQTRGSLIQDCEIVNINGSIELRNDFVTTPVVRDCSIKGGSGRRNGGIIIRDGAEDGYIENCVIDGITGTTGYPLGAITFLESSESGALNTNSNFTIVNTLVKNSDKVMYFEGGNHDNINIINSTFANNDILYQINTTETYSLTNSHLYNCIIYNTPSEKTGTAISGWDFEYNNYWDYWGTNGTPPSGTGNISINPNFINSINFVPQNTLLKVGSYVSHNRHDKIYNYRQNPPTIGAYDIYVEGADTTPPTGTEIYSQNNAASISEVNATTGWSHSSSSTSVSTTDPFNGSYSIKITANNASYGRAEYDFNVTAGKTYDIVIWTKAGQGNKQRFVSWLGFDSSPNLYIPEQTWTKREFTLTASTTGTAKIRAYAASGGAIGDELYLDGISIIEN